MFKKYYQRFKFLRHVQYKGSNSFTIFDKSAEINIKKGSQIIINGVLKIGGSLPESIEIPSYNKTRIVMEEDTKLVIEGDVYIASGTFIHIKKGATLKLKGRNFIGHNNFLVCSKEISLGKNTSTSWNVTLIDHDGHTLYFSSGKPLKKMIRPLIIEDNVGIQMNVTIPSGITIGKNSLIGANSVIRENIPSNSLIYHRNELRRKDGISAGLQFFT
ncbi:MAG: acyltransferase [Bacteriovoracaceae bacterium]|nr:acyltransferase [Bacteriovoracaceae bacterium]